MDDGIGEDALHKVLAEVFGKVHYEIVKSCVIDIRENFNCVIRTCFEEDPSITFFQQCESWKRKFVAAVHSNFIYWEQKVGKYYEFRKQYVCHLNSRNKSEIGKRNLKCWARLEFKKLRIPKSDSTRWRDLKRGGFLSKGLDTEIKITFKHTHPVFNAQQLRLQRVTDDTRDAFEEYFSNGMGAAGAKAFHEMQILSNVLLPAEEEQMTLADASLNPTHRQIANMYENWRSALKPPPVDIDPEITKSIAHALSSAPDAIEQLRLLLVDSIRKDPRYANKPINSYLATPLIHGSYVEDSIPIVSKPSQHVDKGKILPPKIKTEIEDIKAEPPSPPALSLPEELYVSDGNDSDSMDGLTLALGNDNRCKGCGESKWASNNRLIECVECHAYYHQECHIPPVLKSDVNDPRFVWYCNGCSPSNSLSKSHPVPLGISSSGSSLTSKSSSGKSSPHVSSRSSPLQSFSNKGSSGSKSSHSSKSSSSSSSSGSGSSSNNKLPQPKINLITADKRLQIMKKKAAKKQEETRSKRKTK